MRTLLTLLFVAVLGGTALYGAFATFEAISRLQQQRMESRP
jgi:hypothetical protein